ncbi:DUF3718 domain-containing protein [Glaciecola sp. KUL10]|uniref:DUF3718 domain-containing protein n=1 Tax=Glaciecola sp. (strain KUL10) TaxID=2161813 RepID=UPI000D783A3F|nr:DUF3718 domain-containing protein [Glaciecola sp. KUL10]GBL05030.1 hypothetical protein KUL10_23480 [Glaciecola sp. KUL10]
MNKLIKLSVVAFSAQLLLSTATEVNAGPVDPTVEKRLVAVCTAIKSGNKLSLKRAIKRAHLNERAIIEGLKCNGMDPITFAMSNGAPKNADYLAKRSGKDNFQLAASKP